MALSRATLTVERPLPSQIVERIDPQSVDDLYNDEEASEILRSGANRARNDLDASAKRIGLKNDTPDIHYGFSGVRAWSVWYQRVYS